MTHAPGRVAALIEVSLERPRGDLVEVSDAFRRRRARGAPGAAQRDAGTSDRRREHPVVARARLRAPSTGGPADRPLGPGGVLLGLLVLAWQSSPSITPTWSLGSGPSWPSSRSPGESSRPRGHPVRKRGRSRRQLVIAFSLAAH